MRTKSYVKLVVLILLGISAFLIFKQSPEPVSMGGVARGNEYMSTSTPFFGAGAGPSIVREKTALVQQLIGSTTPDSFVPPVLGSVTVASTTGHTLRIWDATSTAALNDALALPTTHPYLFDGKVKLIATFATSTTVGTWDFDYATRNGLIVECEFDFNGDYVILYR